MRINDAQKKVDDWIKKYGVRYFNELTNMSLLMEEVGELARIFSRKFGEQSFKNDEEEQNMADEMADVLFVLICLANQTGVNLEDAFKKNLEKKSNRDDERHHLNKKLL
jgi:NTP pyrophosphatase (non-canonical NTP hydrolase)